MDNEKKYVVTANYSKEEISFKNIVEKHIKNLIKNHLKSWQTKENTVKYNQL